MIFQNAENIHLRSLSAKFIIIFFFCSYVSFAQNQGRVLRQGKILTVLQRVDDISCHHKYTKDELKTIIENASSQYKNAKGYVVRNFGPNINSKNREYCALMLNKLFTLRHTDAEGTDIYNRVLSIKRAEAVSEFQIDHGMPIDKIIAKGLGEKELLEYHEGRSAAKRRVDLILKLNIDALRARVFNDLNGK